MKQAGRFTRDGKPFNFDVITDRLDNSNLVLLGVSGSGKSVNLVEKLIDSVARHNARLVIVDPGASLDLMVTALEAQGKTINRQTATWSSPSTFDSVALLQVESVESLIVNTTHELSLRMLCSDTTMQDVIHFDISPLTQRGKNLEKATLVTSILCAVSECLSKIKDDGRPTIVVYDEFHYLFESAHSAFVAATEIALQHLNSQNAWVWLASQNIMDIPVQLYTLLKRFEWWEVLQVSEHEIESIRNCRPITDDEVAQISSLKRRTGVFVEGMLLSRPGEPVNPVFCYAATSVSVALSMNEPFEKKRRTDLMRSSGLTEMQAVQEIAKELDLSRFSYAN